MEVLAPEDPVAHSSLPLVNAYQVSAASCVKSLMVHNNSTQSLHHFIKIHMAFFKHKTENQQWLWLRANFASLSLPNHHFCLILFHTCRVINT